MMPPPTTTTRAWSFMITSAPPGDPSRGDVWHSGCGRGRCVGELGVGKAHVEWDEPAKNRRGISLSGSSHFGACDYSGGICLNAYSTLMPRVFWADFAV